jgi:hypothetical protein
MGKMTTPDLFRAVLISLAALLIGVTAFGSYAAWRDRYLPPIPKRLPLLAVFLFVAGYILLLVQVAVERWQRLGESIGVGAWVSLAALAFEIVAMFLLIRSSSVPRIHGKDG